MTKIKLFSMIIPLVLFFLSGCATSYPTGVLYTEFKNAGSIGVGSTTTRGAITYSKVGKATCTSVLSLVATGDASIETAAKNGGIKNIKFIDHQAKNILGIYGEYTTIVYGD
jgi:hypothetical protein